MKGPGNRNTQSNYFPYDEESLLSTPRSSFDHTNSEKVGCDISVFDESLSSTASLVNDYAQGATFRIPHDGPDNLSVALESCLQARDNHKTRWIHLNGSSKAVLDNLSVHYLDNHGCLEPQDILEQSIGGPIRCQNGRHFVWAQLPIWSASQDDERRHIEQCFFKIVVCLPTPTEAGTVITNLTGKPTVVDRVSRMLTTDLLGDHAMGSEALSCVWVLAFSITRALVAQLNTALKTFDPLHTGQSVVPSMNQLPAMLKQASKLTHIERYLAGIGEVVEFFDAVKLFQESQGSGKREDALQHCYSAISPRSGLESTITKHRLEHARELCHSHTKQHQNQMQMMLSHSTATIADKLENGSKIAERIAAVGVVLAAISGLTSPLALLTGYFGMNVSELVDGGQSNLYEFWKVATPVLAFSVMVLGVLVLRVVASLKTSAKGG